MPHQPEQSAILCAPLKIYYTALTTNYSAWRVMCVNARVLNQRSAQHTQTHDVCLHLLCVNVQNPARGKWETNFPHSLWRAQRMFCTSTSQPVSQPPTYHFMQQRRQRRWRQSRLLLQCRKHTRALWCIRCFARDYRTNQQQQPDTSRAQFIIILAAVYVTMLKSSWLLHNRDVDQMYDKHISG